MKQLETKNHRVNSKDRDIKEFKGYVKGIKKNIKCKVNKEGDIREYVSGIPKHLIGEQLFTFKAVKRLGLDKRLPSYDDFRSNDHSKFLVDNNILFTGYWDSNFKKLYDVDKWEYYWLSDGDDAELNKCNLTHNNNNPEFGFSLRLLKELDLNV